MSIILNFQLAIDEPNTPQESQFEAWVDLSYLSSDPGEVCLRICSQAEIQALNKQFRQKDKPTNVLSFEYGDEIHDPNEPQFLGDIIICHDIVLDEANAQGKTLEDHYAHLTIHGMLHLQGYDHIDDADAEVMESLEIKLLNELGIANPYEAKHER